MPGQRDQGDNLELAGKRALVMGLGRHQGGSGVARYLVGAGADVTVTDLRGEDELRPVLEALEGLPIRYVLGGHQAEDFDSADIVVRNPAVPPDSHWLTRARIHGARIVMEMELFFRACPAPIIGVTGTKGKTTTSTLIARMLRQFRADTVLAGNMGASALHTLPKIQPDTPVVLELSSWQLEGLAESRLSPHIAVFTNISQDHRDRYPNFDDYVEAKRNIARFQRPDDWFIVNRDDPIVWESRDAGPARVVAFGRCLMFDSDDVEYGATTRDGSFVWHRPDAESAICRVDELPRRSAEWISNALAAFPAAILAGASTDDVRDGLLDEAPLRDRQEIVGTVEGITYVNDSCATAPAATIAALEVFGQPVDGSGEGEAERRSIILIAGGSDKQVDLTEMAKRAARDAEAIVLLAGSATEKLRELLLAVGAIRVLGPYHSMEKALDAASALARPGSVVLLSPGCASFGLFRDEFDRGEQFRQAVGSRLRRAGFTGWEVEGNGE